MGISAVDSGGINSAVTKSFMPTAFQSAVGTADFVAQDFNPGNEQDVMPSKGFQSWE